MYTIAATIAAILAVFGLIFCYAYLPLRKYLYINLSPSWKRRARLYEFSAEDEAAEEAKLLVSSTVLRDASEVIWQEAAERAPEALFGPLAPGAVVHVNAKRIGAFIEQVLPKLTVPIVLVSGCDTTTTQVPGYQALIESDRILHWFLQNFELERPYEGRVTKLPLGLNFHKLEPGGDNTSSDMGLPSRAGNQQLTLLAIRESIPPLAERPARAYANFHLNMDTFLRSGDALKRRRARQQALDALSGRAFMTFERRQAPRNEIWRRHADFAFEVSPSGNGLDCHRTWEAILLKTIPIVKTSPLDSIYDGLPVVIVEDWREVEQTKLTAWREQFQNAFDGPIPEQLYSKHWIERFRSFGEQQRSGHSSGGSGR